MSSLVRNFVFEKSQKIHHAALNRIINAALNVKHTDGIIIHSDLGCQFTSNLFESALAELKIRHSYSKKDCPYDNSCIESFHSVLKRRR